MRSEFRTAIMTGVMIAGVLGLVTVALDMYEPDAALRAGVGPLPAGADKSGLRMAPGVVGATGYVNTTPEDLEELVRDKVVLYDIWTYSCINCVRTLPYITAWDEKYADQGLVIIGVHTPEFEFEKDPRNVEAAVAKHGIGYPVVLDNDWETWKAFENRYWPRKYLADHEGYIRYDHIGEGGYAETERVIQQLLGERAAALGLGAASASSALVDIEEFEHSRYRTPELYFGYELASGRSHLGNPEGFGPGREVAYAPAGGGALRDHMFYMEGIWQNNADHMRLVSETGTIRLPYAAKQVNIVASGNAHPEVLLDGEPVGPPYAGSDVSGGRLQVAGPGLYNIVDGDRPEPHLIEISVRDPGFEIYTFTFG